MLWTTINIIVIALSVAIVVCALFWGLYRSYARSQELKRVKREATKAEEKKLSEAIKAAASPIVPREEGVEMTNPHSPTSVTKDGGSGGSGSYSLANGNPMKENDWSGCPITVLDDPNGFQSPSNEHSHSSKSAEGTAHETSAAAAAAAASVGSSVSDHEWVVPPYWAPISLRVFFPQMTSWVLLGGANAILLWLFKRIISDGNLVVFAVFLSIHFFAFSFEIVLEWYTTSKFTTSVEARARVFVFNHLLKLSPEQASRINGVGYSATFLPMVYRDVVQFLVTQVCPTVGSCIVTFSLLARIHVMFVLTFLFAGVAALFWTDTRQASINDLRNIRSKGKAFIRNDTSDTLNGLAAIKLQGAEEYESKRYASNVKSLYIAEKNMCTGESIDTSVSALFFWFAFGTNCILAYSFSSTSDFLLVFLLCANLLRKLMDSMDQLIQCLGKFEEVEELWGVVFIQPDPLLRPPLPLSWVPVGQSIGLSGPSGAGKSTFLRRLTSGHETETAVGAQVSHIFKRSYIDNICYDQTYSEQQFMLALRIAQLSEVVGKNGSKQVPPLSGGQMQRVLCARAIYKALVVQNAMLVLDEPSSALDVQTERQLFMALRHYVFPNRRVLVVTHRPSVLHMMDRIVHINAMKIQTDKINTPILIEEEREFMKDSPPTDEDDNHTGGGVTSGMSGVDGGQIKKNVITEAEEKCIEEDEDEDGTVAGEVNSLDENSGGLQIVIHTSTTDTGTIAPPIKLSPTNRFTPTVQPPSVEQPQPVGTILNHLITIDATPTSTTSSSQLPPTVVIHTMDPTTDGMMDSTTNRIASPSNEIGQLSPSIQTMIGSPSGVDSVISDEVESATLDLSHLAAQFPSNATGTDSAVDSIGSIPPSRPTHVRTDSALRHRRQSSPCITSTASIPPLRPLSISVTKPPMHTHEIIRRSSANAGSYLSPQLPRPHKILPPMTAMIREEQTTISFPGSPSLSATTSPGSISEWEPPSPGIPDDFQGAHLVSLLPHRLRNELLKLMGLIRQSESGLFAQLEEIVLSEGGKFTQLETRFKGTQSAMEKLARRYQLNSDRLVALEAMNQTTGAVASPPTGPVSSPTVQTTSPTPTSEEPSSVTGGGPILPFPSISPSPTLGAINGTANTTNGTNGVCVRCSIKDLLRYTVILPEDQYAESVKAICQRLDTLEVKNFWGQAIYQGIHVNAGYVVDSSVQASMVDGGLPLLDLGSGIGGGGGGGGTPGMTPIDGGSPFDSPVPSAFPSPERRPFGSSQRPSINKSRISISSMNNTPLLTSSNAACVLPCNNPLFFTYEVQFHTVASWTLKKQSHSIYRKSRSLYDDLLATSLPLVPPRNAVTIGKKVKTELSLKSGGHSISASAQFEVEQDQEGNTQMKRRASVY